jgi:hypothetical protein
MAGYVQANCAPVVRCTVFQNLDKYVCKICGKEFGSMMSLGGHASMVHSTKNRAGIRRASKAMWDARTPAERDAIGKKSLEKRNEWRYGVDLREDQRQLILGSLMGDMSIRYANPRSSFPRVVVSHSIAQADYVQWKYSMLKNLVSTPPRTMANGGWGSPVVRFATMSLPCFTPIHDLVKKGAETRFSEEWLKEVTSPVALAVWYLDDGSLSKQASCKYQKVYGHNIQISLGDSTLEEMAMVRVWLEREWGIRVRSGHYEYPRQGRSSPKRESVIRIHNSADVDAFLEIVRPTALKAGMDYKVTRDYTYTTSQ